MVLIKIESLSQKELEHIAIQEGVQDAASLSREELIEILRDIYDDERDDEAQGGEDNIQRRFVTWLTDYRGDGSEVTSLPGVEDLPELYPETSIHVMMKNATWLYCYWSLSPLDVEKIEEEHGRFSTFLHVELKDGGLLVDSYDISVGNDDVEWNININANRGQARVQLVLETSDGKRLTVAQSRPVTLVSCYWLEHAGEIAQNEDLLRRELGLITNREGQILTCETVQLIVQKIEKEGVR